MAVGVTIKTRRGTAAEWAAANPVLAAGEQGYETDTGILKLGDGLTAYNSLAKFNTPRLTALVIAASDSSAKGKAQADYVCDGTADNVEIQAALNALPATGGELKFLEGTYQLAAPVSRAIDYVTFSGSGFSTYVKYNATNYILSVGSQKNWLFKDMRLDYGGIELINGTWTLTNIWKDNHYSGVMFIDAWSSDHMQVENGDNSYQLVKNHKLIGNISDFETDGIWECVQGGTLTYDTTIKYLGTRSAKIVTDLNAQAYLITSVIRPDLTNCSFSIMLYVDDYTKLSSIQIDVRTTTDADWTHYGKYDSYSVQTVNHKWYKLVFPYLQLGAGTPDYTDVNYIRLRIKPVANQSVTVYVDDFRYWKRNLTTNGAVSFTFDDGLASVYDIAKPAMDKYGYAGVSSYIIGQMTAATITRAKELQANGWDIINHTYDHDTAKTAIEPAWQYILAQKWLADNGFKSGSRFVLLHGGLHNTAILDVMNNISIARSSLGYYNSLPFIKGLVYSRDLRNTTTIETVKTWIDDAYNNNLWLNLMFHDIVTGAPTTYDTTPTIFGEIVDYCNSIGIEVLTFSQVYEKCKTSALQPVTLQGTGTIAGGTTSINIRHGFHKAPSFIQITPTSSLGSASSIWVSSKDVGSTGNLFTVSCNVDPVTAITFDWKAIL